MRLLVGIRKVRNNLFRGDVQLAIGALVLFAVLLGVFFPGYMSADSLHQLRQARGILPLTDWHPLSMTLLWRVLIETTGQVAALLALQLMLLCSALFGLALIVYRHTRKLGPALCVYALAAFPGILGIAGVVWKDVSMTFALFLASVLLLLALTYVHRQRIVILCVALAFILLVYAGTLRYNAVFAIIPLFVAIPYILGRTSKGSAVVACIGGIGLVLLVGSILAAKSQPTHPVTAVMLDDIVHIAPTEGSGVASPTYTHIRSVCDVSTPEIMNSYVLCTTEAERMFILNHHDQIKKDWIKVVVNHPFSYLRYRLAIFAIFLFPDANRMYIYQEGIIENEMGLTANKYSSRALGAYIYGFAKTNSPFIFQPWFWFTALMFILHYSQKQRDSTEKTLVQAVAVSGVLYGLVYAVAAVATDYRYSYWMVLATCFCLVVALKDRRNLKTS